MKDTPERSKMAARFVPANDLVHRLFDLLAVRSNADAACHLEDHDARPDLLLGEFHGFLRLTSRIVPPSAGTSGARLARLFQVRSSPS